MSKIAWQKAFDLTCRLGVAELNWEKPGGYTSEVREPSTAQRELSDSVCLLTCLISIVRFCCDPYLKISLSNNGAAQEVSQQRLLSDLWYPDAHLNLCM